MGRKKKPKEKPRPDCGLCHHYAKSVSRMDGGGTRMCPAINRYVSSEQSPSQCDHYRLYRWVWCAKEHHRVNIQICAHICKERCAMQHMARGYQFGPEEKILPKPEIPNLPIRRPAPEPMVRRRIIQPIAEIKSAPQPVRKPILISNRTKKRVPIPTGGSSG